MGPGFVHLHVHSQYSILDGACRVGQLVSAIAGRDVKAVAITDHGVMHGAVDFINQCKKKGVKPIIGCEFNVTRVHPDSTNKIYHLTAICRTLQGYKNMLYLVSKAHIEEYNDKTLAGYNPLTGMGIMDWSWFKDHAEGLTIFSGDLGSELAQAVIRKENVDAILHAMRDTFEDGQFYLELMANSFSMQKTVNDCYKELSSRTGVPLIATNDVHYIKKEEALAQAILMCIGMKKQIDLDQLKATVVDDFYLKTDEEMYAAFRDVPEACENTLKVAESVYCPVRLGPVFLPQFHTPKSFIEINHIEEPKAGVHEYFKDVARKGLIRRFEQFRKAGKFVDEHKYWQRLEREISVITYMDFPGYFLIVWDFIHWSKEHGIPVGPGRGSGAGSLVAYSMTITDIDPLPFSLLFERFLNPERVSMPDFDVDFCMDRRTETIQYVSEEYGHHNVAQIATFGALKAKAAINSVGRVLNFTPAEKSAITKLVPDDLHITLTAALKDEPKLKELYQNDPRIKTMYDLALQVEDLFCQTGMHAAGIVISEGPLWDYVPVFRGANGEIVAQYAKAEVEEAGLVKFDFLGLKTLTVLQYAMKHVNHTRSLRGEEPLDLSMISLEDANVYQMISQAKTTGVFQLESSGFKKLLLNLKPSCFEDVVAAVALFRPGPMGSGMIDQFIQTKHGERKAEYPHPLLEGVLKETYGVFVYQEQVMQAGQVLSGFSLGRADIMRRAMGKKKPELLAQQRVGFVEGAVKNGVDGTRAGEIFDLIEKFAQYGFNKSHSAAYALITYQTAWLKYYYPVELYAALMTCDQDNPDKVIRTINDARQNGVKVMPPDINHSELNFSVVNGCVLFGLAGIKGVGAAALESVLKSRQEDGPFKGLFDFCSRVDQRVNKRVIEALIQCGAFDSVWDEPLNNIQDIGKARARMFASVQKAMDRSRRTRDDKLSGQTSLFSMFSATPALKDTYEMAPPWPEDLVLENEFALLGFFVSGHPMDHYLQEISLFSTTNINDLNDLNPTNRVTLCGIIKSSGIRTLKSGNKMASGNLEDRTGQVGFVAFARTIDKIGIENFSLQGPVLLTGKLQFSGEDDAKKPEILVDAIESLESVRIKRIAHVLFKINMSEHTTADIEALQIALEQNPGPTHCYLHLYHDAYDYDCDNIAADFRVHYSVQLSDEFLKTIDNILGSNQYAFRLRDSIYA